MRRIALVLVIVWACCGLVPVMAQETATPTPTLTSTPIPTATSYYTRATPTPWVLERNPEAFEDIAFNNDEIGEFADTIIQSYGFLNQNGVLDFAVFVFMTLMLIGLLSKLIRGGKRL